MHKIQLMMRLKLNTHEMFKNRVFSVHEKGKRLVSSSKTGLTIGIVFSQVKLLFYDNC